MSTEQVANGEQPIKYHNVDFAVYEASDFAPQGSLLNESVIKPPYKLSIPPNDIESLQSVIEIVRKTNPKTDIERTLLYFSDTDTDSNDPPLERVKPEEINPVLTVNYLRYRLRGKQKNGDSIRHDEKFVVIKSRKKYRPLLLVDLTTGNVAQINPHANEDEELIRRITNERPKKPIDQFDIKKLREGLKAKKVEPFEENDPQDPKLKEAKDAGKSKTYPPETERFSKRMNSADLNIEYLLITEMASVTAVSEAVHRLSKRIGRAETRRQIQNIRINGLGVGTKLFKEIAKDTKYASKLSDRAPKPVTIDQIKNGFRLLFKAEKLYLDAMIDFPWNQTGPEPFETLIEVFWFRYDFVNLKGKWEDRENRLGLKKLKADLYRKARVEQILTWAYKAHSNLIASNLKELRESGITYTMSEVEKIAGPLHNYFDNERIERSIVFQQEKSRPSGLTLLLWKTLKWAHASDWKQKSTMLTSDFRYVDPEIWEEKFPDPTWSELGDLQGRLVLPGETLEMPLAHIKSEIGSASEQMENEIAFEMEGRGMEIFIDDVVRAKQRIIRQENGVKSFESTALDFSNAVKGLNYDALMRKIKDLPNLQRMVVLHRLGYYVSSERSGLVDKHSRGEAIENDWPVTYLINTFFDRNPHRYYDEVRKITKILLA